MTDKIKQELSTKYTFLPTGNQIPKDDYNQLGKIQFENNIYVASEKVLFEIKTLKAGELKKKYPRSYKCWDNMKQRKKKGAIIHKEFSEFKDFLKHIGPCEDKEYTLDRIDNDDPEYAPAKVAWRDKHAQNSNKSNNVYLVHDNGRKHTVAQWANITKQNSDTLYKRKKAGWSDMEIITGKKDLQSSTQINSDVNDPFPYENKEEWEKAYLKSILIGFDETKLEFLNRKSKALTEVRREKAIEISMEIDCYQSREDFENENLNTLKEKLKVEEGQFKKYRKIYEQALSLLNFLNEKQLVLDKKPKNKLAKQLLIENFNKYHPQPEYTINKPDSSFDEL